MPDSSSKSARRRELAEFLRSRRERLQPEEVGLPPAARRRTPGLRREEVAELAGVGATWYTWLEQARDIQPSEEVLDRLAGALRLSRAEREHLRALAGRPASEHLGAGDPPIPPALERAMADFVSCPALILGRRWDVLALNERARNAFQALAMIEPDRRNWVRMVFQSARVKERVLDWERNARRVLAEFRLSVADSLDDPWIDSFVEEMRQVSSEFRDWWNERHVRDLSTAAFAVRDDEGRVWSYDRLVLAPAEGGPHRLAVFMPRETT